MYMKPFLFAAFAALCFPSCKENARVAGASSDNTMIQKNLDASHVVDKAFRTGDVSGIDSVVADDFVDHTDHGDKKGRDSLKAMINMIHTDFKDMKMETKEELADKDYVFTWMRYSGTSNGAMGMPKGPYDMHAIEVVRFNNGKAVEHWSYMDMAELAKMMPPAGHMDKNQMDSSRMKK